MLNQSKKMKTRKLVCMSDIAFSHRPHTGISIGVINLAGVAYIAGAFVRDGDEFNRPLARKIIVDRLSSNIFKGKNVKFVDAIEHVDGNIDGRTIMSALRHRFKPDPNEADVEFYESYNIDFGDGDKSTEVRDPMSRMESWNKIVNMFHKTVSELNV